MLRSPRGAGHSQIVGRSARGALLSMFFFELGQLDYSHQVIEKSRRGLVVRSALLLSTCGAVAAEPEMGFTMTAPCCVPMLYRRTWRFMVLTNQL